MNPLLKVLTVMMISIPASSVVLQHSVKSTSIFSGGSIDVWAEQVEDNQVLVNLRYVLKTRAWIPKPDQKGLNQIHLPESFLSETAYIDLEENGFLDQDGFKEIRFVDRVHVGRYKDVYRVFVSRANGEWSAYLYYHPSIPSVGWLRLDMIMHGAGLGGADVKFTSTFKGSYKTED